MGLFKQDRQNADIVDDDVQPRDLAGPELELEILARERIQLLRERDELVGERDELVGERDRLRGELDAAIDENRRLEAELARYRAHAERTGKLILRATDYAIGMRATARRDAELALRKARARAAEILGDVVHERKRVERELLRLYALASETRAKLEELTMDSLSMLAPRAETEGAPQPETASEDLEEALRGELATTRARRAELYEIEGQDERRP